MRFPTATTSTTFLVKVLHYLISATIWWTSELFLSATCIKSSCFFYTVWSWVAVAWLECRHSLILQLNFALWTQSFTLVDSIFLLLNCYFWGWVLSHWVWLVDESAQGRQTLIYRLRRMAWYRMTSSSVIYLHIALRIKEVINVQMWIIVVLRCHRSMDVRFTILLYIRHFFSDFLSWLIDSCADNVLECFIFLVERRIIFLILEHRM